MPSMLKKYLTTLADRYFEKRTAGPAPEKRWHDLYDVPLDDLKQRASSGDADAAFVLGDIYDQGYCGVTLDRVQAVEWYEKATALGHGDAMNNIASMYQHGDGPFPVDLLKARDYYEQGVKAGCGTAMGNLGHFYADGSAGLKQDHRRAVKLFSQGAHRGDGDSMVSLGHRCSTGTGIRKSPTRALYWYRRALQAGNSRGANNLGVAYYYGTVVQEDAEKGVQLLAAALDGGFDRAAYTLGVAHEDGKGTWPADEENPVMAVQLIKVTATDHWEAIITFDGSSYLSCTVKLDTIPNIPMNITRTIFHSSSWKMKCRSELCGWIFARASEGLFAWRQFCLPINGRAWAA